MNQQFFKKVHYRFFIVSFLQSQRSHQLKLKTIFVFHQRFIRRTISLKAMLHETIGNDDF